MINNATHKTKVCKCDNPKLELLHVRTVTKGKNCGQKIGLYHCNNCGAQFERKIKEKK